MATELLNVLSDDVVNSPYHGVIDKMYWRVAGSDRCAVNYSALNEIEKSANVRPFYSPCIPHGLNNAGKKMKAPSVEFVRKYLNAITRGKVGKSRTLFYNLFKQRPARSGQVR